jgi:hypothetical protein
VRKLLAQDLRIGAVPRVLDAASMMTLPIRMYSMQRWRLPAFASVGLG